ncbi:MAG: PASTA domain-containing protein, partial [Clostridia bacterium]|nr:PASTA domain-containing protein [Clostridia bacterium]
SSFVGFAPADNPQYAILMTIDEPNSYAYYGSIVAAPYVGQTFSKIFDYLEIKPTENIEETEWVAMPFLDGKSINESISILEKLGLKYEIAGEGEVVKDTIPIVDEKVAKGDIVLLRT